MMLGYHADDLLEFLAVCTHELKVRGGSADVLGNDAAERGFDRYGRPNRYGDAADRARSPADEEEGSVSMRPGDEASARQCEPGARPIDEQASSAVPNHGNALGCDGSGHDDYGSLSVR